MPARRPEAVDHHPRASSRVGRHPRARPSVDIAVAVVILLCSCARCSGSTTANEAVVRRDRASTSRLAETDSRSVAVAAKTVTDEESTSCAVKREHACNRGSHRLLSRLCRFPLGLFIATATPGRARPSTRRRRSAALRPTAPLLPQSSRPARCRCCPRAPARTRRLPIR